jgi:hypothetical protein
LELGHEGEARAFEQNRCEEITDHVNHGKAPLDHQQTVAHLGELDERDDALQPSTDVSMSPAPPRVFALAELGPAAPCRPTYQIRGPLC